MLYMIIERFRDGPEPVYARFRQRGRMASDRLQYINSWVTLDGSTCYQVMQTDAPELLDEWMDAWRDLVDFDVIPVLTSVEAAARYEGPASP